MIGDSENPTSDDALEHAIRDAMRLEINDERLARIERYWRVQSQRERWRRSALRVLASVAAGVAIITATVFIWQRDGRLHDVALSAADSAKEIVESGPARSAADRHTNPIERSE